jgi:two-component system sensor histidine kinase YesM
MELGVQVHAVAGPSDGVVLSAVIMHIPDSKLFDTALAVRARLKDGGRLVLSTALERGDAQAGADRDASGRLMILRPASQVRLLFERLRERSCPPRGPGVEWRPGRRGSGQAMRFQTRLLSTYSVLIILLVVMLGVIFYSYSARVFENTAYTNLSVIAEKMSQQLDNLIRPMDFITTYLLSNGDFMSSMASLANMDRSNPRNLLYINEGWQTINATLLSYSVGKNFYSVNVFNRQGDFLSSNFSTHRTIGNVSTLIAASPWIERADGALGRALILPPYVDPWNQNEKVRVFGLARSVQGPTGGMGYVEVQNPYSDLQRLFSVPDKEDISVLAVMRTGDVFFSSRAMDASLASYYSTLARSLKTSVSFTRNSVTGQDEIVTGSASEYTGIAVLLAQDKNALLGPLRFTRNMTFLIAVLIIAMSLVYNYLSSRQLTRPLRQLTQTMEKTGLENLPDSFTFESANDEIEALNISFQRLRARLNEAVGREIRSQSLQMQARLDSLQAQVNPHFIYNVLTVISSRGMEAGDEEICEICDGIASMLRYSTSTTKRAATIGEEIEHVKTYLSLMKRRFEHRLEYRIEVDPALLAQPVPKIVLQQIAENSINHGYQSVQKVMRITLRGSVQDGRWLVEMTDNGQGFDPLLLRALRERMATVRKEASHQGTRTGMAIGGMGIVATCARLALFYDADFIFTLENAEEGGARVTIGAPMRAPGKERADAASAPG